MNVKVSLLLFAVAGITIMALVWVSFPRGDRPENCTSLTRDALEEDPTGQLQSLVFSDLNPTELSQVVQYLKENLGVDLADAAEAKPSDNCVYFLDVQYPNKQEALNYLDKSGPRPKREALAVVFFGSQPVPNITEYVVGPLPAPTYHLDITLQKYKGHLPYYRRPVIEKEHRDVYNLIFQKELAKAPTFIEDTFGYNGASCTDLNSSPLGFRSGDRRTWFVLSQNMTDSETFLYPAGLEILVDHQSLNTSNWRVAKVFYKGEYFQDMVHLEEEYKAGKVSVLKVGQQPKEDIASLKPKLFGTANAPFQYEPTGPRYSVKDNQVHFMSWRFSFGKNVNSGLRLFDIRFNGDRIIYELSVQEATAIYGSNAPSGIVTRYIDSCFAIGRWSRELVRGVDCPYLASYVDTHHIMESQTPETVKNSICIFEQNSGVPLRRHYSSHKSMRYGGLSSTVLVIRAISTISNYDYVWDFIFYQSGAIEAKVSLTGYISSSFLYGDGLDFGSRVGEHILGTLHTHSMNYKVDFDIAGRKVKQPPSDKQRNVGNTKRDRAPARTLPSPARSKESSRTKGHDSRRKNQPGRNEGNQPGHSQTERSKLPNSPTGAPRKRKISPRSDAAHSGGKHTDKDETRQRDPPPHQESSEPSEGSEVPAAAERRTADPRESPRSN
ncbi:amine oxidase [copper-containing] 3-like [Ambystoma mexicanum]|uniref:amine oxidase [copper-containing] 3-like n=1 Tax=Ambystoma mexicanum TaxID=8296 RepID=UPI0037E897A5